VDCRGVVAVSRWPAVPRPGEYVRLPVPLPPLLLDALGYIGGDGRLVSLFWLPRGAELLVCDGPIAQPADLEGWSQFADHPLGAALLRPYHLRSLDGPPTHSLVADLWAGTLSVGLDRDVGALLRSQPNLIGATVAMADESWPLDEVADTAAEIVISARVAAAALRPDLGRAARHAVRLWMDEQAELIDAGADLPDQPAGPPDGPDLPPSGPEGLDLG
jgi:hypothetical protein